MNMNDYDIIKAKIYDRNSRVIDRVEYILEHYPESRNSQKKLLKIYYLLFHQIDIGFLFCNKDVPMIQTVTRAARKVQNTWEKYQPDKDIKEYREVNTMSQRSYHK